MTNRISVVMFAVFLAATTGIGRSQTPEIPTTPGLPQVPTNLEEIRRREAAVRAKAIEALKPGASWSFAITSLDRTLNGRTITVTFKEKTTYGRLFDVAVDGSAAKSATIDDFEGPWFVPVETGAGTFTIQSVSAPSGAIEGKAMTWRSSSSQHEYVIEDGQPVPSGGKTITFIKTSLARPACVVPAGTFKCVAITTKKNAVVETTTWLHSDTPAALYYQMKRPKPKSGLITFKLTSRKAAEGREAAISKLNWAAQLN